MKLDEFEQIYGRAAAKSLRTGTPAHLYRVEIEARENPFHNAMPEDKPHGLYFSVVPHTKSRNGWAVGHPTRTFDRRARLAVPLDDPTVLYVEPFALPNHPRLLADAGPSSFRQLKPGLLQQVFEAMVTGPGVRGVDAVRALMQEEYPEVDWSPFVNSEQFVIAGGAVEARRLGYRAMLGVPLPWAGVPEPELIALTNDSIQDMTATPKRLRPAQAHPSNPLLIPTYQAVLSALLEESLGFQERWTVG